jgi:hypothetical protein
VFIVTCPASMPSQWTEKGKWLFIFIYTPIHVSISTYIFIFLKLFYQYF